MLLSDAFEGSEVWFACTDARQGIRYELANFVAIEDYSQDEPLKMLKGLYGTFRILRRIRPDVVLSTGAAPGLLCLLWGRVFGARTIWVDSIANSEGLSLSGRLAQRIAHLVLTQWEHLATETGAQYRGSII
ncbi:UDP-N-acetylglucosamine--LPS N-acetylglucosamine transferase [Palleronia marisminoris]|nr:UDP-N-acetylglucosamine--LPS N-acetylglucosamine transferase [Palleronia marisminoris]